MEASPWMLQLQHIKLHITQFIGRWLSIPARTLNNFSIHHLISIETTKPKSKCRATWTSKLNLRCLLISSPTQWQQCPLTHDKCINILAHRWIHPAGHCAESPPLPALLMLMLHYRSRVALLPIHHAPPSKPYISVWFELYQQIQQLGMMIASSPMMKWAFRYGVRESDMYMHTEAGDGFFSQCNSIRAYCCSMCGMDAHGIIEFPFRFH